MEICRLSGGESLVCERENLIFDTFIGTLYLTVPILVHFLCLGALFNESVLSNFLNAFSVMMFYVFLLLCVCVSLLKSLYCN